MKAKTLIWITMIFLAAFRFVLLPLFYLNFHFKPDSYLDLAFGEAHMIEFFQELLALAILVFLFEIVLHQNSEEGEAKKILLDFLETGFTSAGDLSGDMQQVKRAYPILKKHDVNDIKDLLLGLSPQKKLTELTPTEVEVTQKIIAILRKSK